MLNVSLNMNHVFSLWSSLSTVCIDNKALYFSLRGKALNVTSKYDTQAVDFLSKAVKLNPSLTDAWNNLGECYWKSKDIDAAKNCFTQALSKVNITMWYWNWYHVNG